MNWYYFSLIVVYVFGIGFVQTRFPQWGYGAGILWPLLLAILIVISPVWFLMWLGEKTAGVGRHRRPDHARIARLEKELAELEEKDG